MIEKLVAKQPSVPAFVQISINNVVDPLSHGVEIFWYALDVISMQLASMSGWIRSSRRSRSVLSFPCVADAL